MRQNFMAIFLIVLLFSLYYSFMNNRNKIYLVLSLFSTIPSFLYLLFLFINRALPDFFLQITSYTSFLNQGLYKYLYNPFFLIGLLLNTLFYVLNKLIRWEPLKKIVNGVFLLLFLTFTLYGLCKRNYASVLPFIFFGAVLCQLLLTILTSSCSRKIDISSRLVILISVLILSWMGSISIGYNTPALTSGILLLVLMAEYTKHLTREVRKYKQLFFVLLTTYFIVALIIFNFIRINYIYRDRSKDQLKYRLDKILPGGSLIVTNINTYKILRNLNQLVRATNEPYVITPDFAAWWVQADEPNLLSIDWPNGTETRNSLVKDRLISNIKSLRGKTTFIVQKYMARTFAIRFKPFPEDSYYSVTLDYVRNNLTRIKETPYFEIYR
jgi:hypothetical protein